MKKPFWLSKTIIFNALWIALHAADAFGFSGWKPDPGLVSFVDKLGPVVNVVLRFVTKQPVI